MNSFIDLLLNHWPSILSPFLQVNVQISICHVRLMGTKIEYALHQTVSVCNKEAGLEYLWWPRGATHSTFKTSENGHFLP